MKETQYKA